MKEKTKKSILTFGLIGAGFIALMSLFKKDSVTTGFNNSGGGVNFDVLSTVKPNLTTTPTVNPKSSFDDVSTFKPDSIDNGMDNNDDNGNVKAPTNIKKANIGTNDISDSGAVEEEKFYGLTQKDLGSSNDWYFTDMEKNNQIWTAKNAKTNKTIKVAGVTPAEFIELSSDPQDPHYNPQIANAVANANQYGTKYAENPNDRFNENLNLSKLSNDKLLDNDDNSGAVGSAGTDYYNKVANKEVYKTEKEFYTAMGNIGKRH